MDASAIRQLEFGEEVWSQAHHATCIQVSKGSCEKMIVGSAHSKRLRYEEGAGA
mgnify:CR=1 FL=1